MLSYMALFQPGCTFASLMIVKMYHAHNLEFICSESWSRLMEQDLWIIISPCHQNDVSANSKICKTVEHFPLNMTDTLLWLLHNSTDARASDITPHNENTPGFGVIQDPGLHQSIVDFLCKEYKRWTIIYEGFSVKSYFGPALLSTSYT